MLTWTIIGQRVQWQETPEIEIEAKTEDEAIRKFEEMIAKRELWMEADGPDAPLSFFDMLEEFWPATVIAQVDDDRTRPPSADEARDMLEYSIKELRALISTERVPKRERGTGPTRWGHAPNVHELVDRIEAQLQLYTETVAKEKGE